MDAREIFDSIETGEFFKGMADYVGSQSPMTEEELEHFGESDLTEEDIRYMVSIGKLMR